MTKTIKNGNKDVTIGYGAEFTLNRIAKDSKGNIVFIVPVVQKELLTGEEMLYNVQCSKPVTDVISYYFALQQARKAYPEDDFYLPIEW